MTPIETIKTTTDLHLIRQDFQILLDELYANKPESFGETLRTRVSHKTHLFLTMYFQDNNLDFKNANIIEKNIKKIIEEFNELEEIRLTIALEPDPGLVSDIYEWFKENNYSHFVLNISVDPKVIGGAIISIGGNYYKYSIADDLETSLTELNKNLTQLRKIDAYTGS